MKKLNKEMTLLASSLQGNKGRLLLIVASIALFVLSAGAPAASVSIGK